jgi:predicted NBD/HSP70 family sugar kinase
MKPIPSEKKLLSEQLELYKTSLRRKKIRKFDIGRTLKNIANASGQKIIAIDIGGNKIETSIFLVKGKNIVVDEASSEKLFKRNVFESDEGSGYLKYLELISKITEKTEYLVGVSTAGTVDDTKLISSANIPIFIDEFHKEYGGDFSKLFNKAIVLNDAAAGALASVFEERDGYLKCKNFIFFINGGGVGGAVITKGELWSTEPGHMPLIDELNFFAVSRVCHDGKVCLEKAAASGAGIEEIWEVETGERLDGEEISAKFQNGNELAKNLYEQSAYLSAHAVRGLSDQFGLLQKQNDTVLVFHGGVFKVPGYDKMLVETLKQNIGFEIKYLNTADLKKNLSLYGAAYACLAFAGS